MTNIQIFPKDSIKMKDFKKRIAEKYDMNIIYPREKKFKKKEGEIKNED